ncbi:3280_t:CDS:1 [Entrophospora sp. SA101]|nr:3280_t:CDS:1 [Entrophospora sp. SA101]
MRSYLNNETRIKSLVRDLEHSNLEIHYLGKSLIQHEAQIESLKKDNKNLSIQLRKALQDIESKEKFIVFREEQFIALEDKISTLNKKPKMSSQCQIQPPSPNEIDVSTDRINSACRSLDEFIQRPDNSLQIAQQLKLLGLIENCANSWLRMMRSYLNNETRIKSLVRDLEHSNLEIHYLGKSLIQHEAQIESLKKDNKNLSIQLRKALQDIESKEKFIVFREEQFIALEDKISTLNKKPKMSSQCQIQPPSPNEIDVSTDRINSACRSLDEFIQRPDNSTLNQRTAVNKLNEITTFTHRLRDIAKWNDDQLAPLQAQLQQNLQAFNQVNNQLAQAQNDLNQLHQDFLQLNVAHAQLNNTHIQFVNARDQFINNIHNPLVQAYNYHNGRLQMFQQKHIKWKQRAKNPVGQLQIFQQKYVKWKQRARNPDVIWLVGFSN